MHLKIAHNMQDFLLLHKTRFQLAYNEISRSTSSLDNVDYVRWFLI